MSESSEIPVSPEKDPQIIAKYVSFILIKPENMDKAVIFPPILKNYGFKSEINEKVFTHEDVSRMYPDIDSWDEEVQKVTYELVGKRLQMILLVPDENSPIKHQNVVDEVLKIRGDKTSPLKCEPGTLRNVHYGKKLFSYTDKSGEAVDYWENGIHCPRNADELMSNLEIFNLRSRAEEIAREELSKV